MSLINDALQRAKQQTAQPAPSHGLPLRPMEPVAEPRKSSGLVSAFVCVGVLCIAAWVGLIAFKSNRRNDAQPAAAAPAVQLQAAAPVEKPVAAKPEVVKPMTAAKPIEPATQSSNSVSMAADAPALRPAPLKLQAILFSSTRPSAMINGKTVYVGNRVGEFRVASITQTSATLVSDSMTNILCFQE